MNPLTSTDMTPVEAVPNFGMGQQDFTELGANLVASGFSVDEARSLVAEVQQVATQVALSMAPRILERVRRIRAAEIFDMYRNLQLLPNTLGYVQRDRVLMIVQNATNTRVTN